ncbi:MAG: cupin domain-containing protein [Pseudonocardiaceae bacterium]
MVTGRNVIENPISGERIVIRKAADETGGVLLVWELFLAPGGRVPSSHAHPEQEERFTVLDGRMEFRVGGRVVIVVPMRRSLCHPEPCTASPMRADVLLTCWWRRSLRSKWKRCWRRPLRWLMNSAPRRVPCPACST